MTLDLVRINGLRSREAGRGVDAFNIRDRSAMIVRQKFLARSRF